MLAEHKCDFVCQYVTTIAPIETPIFSMAPKVKATGIMHEWITDKLTPIEPHTGWWWRYVVKWWYDLRWKWVVRNSRKGTSDV